MIDTAELNADKGLLRKRERFHFRVLVLDYDTNRTDVLEKSFLSMYDGSGSMHEESTLAVREDAQFYYVRNVEQLSALPGASAYNAAWISFDFPDCRVISEKIYLENPFCYQVFYGQGPEFISDILHSRPIGYVRDIADTDSVFCEMSYIWRISALEKEVLKLTSRSSYCTVAFGRILYCQSQGHKSYIYVNTPVRDVKTTEDDIFVKNSENLNELFAYVQNKKMDDIAVLLPKDKFVRVHQSYIVNTDYVKGIRMKREGWFVILKDFRGFLTEIPVSERYRWQAKEIFGLVME